MSDLLTTYTTFSAIDYKGQNILSAFALSATPFTFVADLPTDTLNKVLWSFGDGTTSTSLQPTKSYDYPGEYVVNLFIYDCFGNVRVSSYSQTVIIHDFFPLSFRIDLPAGSQYNTLTAVNAQMTGPLSVKAQYPYYQKPIDIYYQFIIPGETSYWNISANPYAHLEKFNSMYQKTYNYYLSSFQFQEIDKITPVNSKVFGKLVDGQIVICPSTDIGSFFVGISGEKVVYAKSDADYYSGRIKFKFDNTELYSPFDYDAEYVSYFNNLGITLSTYGVENTSLGPLSITSNGLDGEGYHITSFDISPIKFENVRIPFVTKVKDLSGFSHKSLTISNNTFAILSGGGFVSSYYYELSSLAGTLSSFGHNGSVRHYVKFRNLTTALSNVSISANMAIIFQTNDGTGRALSGQSAKFTVYTDKYYDIYKKNEDFDAEGTFKNLRFQEFLLDKEVLFGDFMGTIFGSVSSTYDTLGKKIYEKIANFVENNVDIDRDEIYSLISQMEMMNNDTNIYDSTLMNYPEKVKRILNFASISRNRLMGTPNKFRENFDPKGHTQKNEYGINLGNQINTDTYQITAGVPIVALEKFSGAYTLLNTYQPVCAVATNLFKLSGYSADWGWPLVLPSGFVYNDFPKYYYFFEYVDQFDGRNTNFTIDFANPLTTLLSTTSNNELFRTNGIFENMIANTLYDSLSLFEV